MNVSIQALSKAIDKFFSNIKTFQYDFRNEHFLLLSSFIDEECNYKLCIKEISIEYIEIVEIPLLLHPLCIINRNNQRKRALLVHIY